MPKGNSNKQLGNLLVLEKTSFSGFKMKYNIEEIKNQIICGDVLLELKT